MMDFANVSMALMASMVAVYFLPTIVAVIRGHINSGAIFTLNLLLGWTAIFWIVCLVWSFTNSRPVVVNTTVIRESRDTIYNNRNRKDPTL